MPSDLWFESDSGNLAIYYDDGDSAQWVGVGGEPGPAGAAGPAGPTGPVGATGATGTATMDYTYIDTQDDLRVLHAGDTGVGLIDFAQVPTVLTVPVLTEAPTDDAVYARKNGVWEELEMIRISDTPPTNPRHGQLWWQSTTGAFFICYDDGDSVQWVEAGGENSTTTKRMNDLEARIAELEARINGGVV